MKLRKSNSGFIIETKESQYVVQFFWPYFRKWSSGIGSSWRASFVTELRGYSCVYNKGLYIFLLGFGIYLEVLNISKFNEFKEQYMKDGGMYVTRSK